MAGGQAALILSSCFQHPASKKPFLAIPQGITGKTQGNTEDRFSAEFKLAALRYPPKAGRHHEVVLP
jgi:hypothetical protein